MKNESKLSFSIFLNVVVVSIMCVILIASVSLLNGALFKTGYTAYVTNEKGQTVEKYVHYISEGEDTKIEKFRKDGYAVSTVNIVSKTGKVVEFVFLTFVSFLILIMFIYNKIYIVGNRDFNLVKCGHITEKKYKGLIVGLIGNSVAEIMFLITVVLRFVKPSVSVGYYKLVNIIYFNILNSVMGKKTLADIPFWGFLVMFLLVLVVPLISHISYTLGYKDIKISDKLTYKKGEIK